MQPVSLSLLLCLCLLLATSWAVPPPDSQMTGESVRLPRATCDLLSVNIMGNSLGHSACAAHCLALRRGFRGGRCRDGVCHCRK